MRIIFFILLASVLFSGCRSAPTVAFDPSAAEFINKPGGTKIDGHAFFRAETGRVIFAAGEYAYLIPVTPYAEQRFFQVYGKGKYIQTKYMPWDDADAQFKKYMRSTKAESTGRSSFDKVGPGEYFIATSATWQPENSFLTVGAAVYERVTITGKETEPVKVIVSGR